MGLQSVVVRDPQSRRRVLAYEHTKQIENPLDLLEKYHMHGVLHILYPEHFPAIYGVDPSIGFNARQYVKPKPPIEDLFEEQREVRRMARGLKPKVKMTSGLNIDLDDSSLSNYIQAEDGNLYYIDFINNNAGNFNIDPNKAIQYFEEKNKGLEGTKKYEVQRKRLMWSMKRIKELAAIDELRYHTNQPDWDYYINNGSGREILKNFTNKQKARILKMAYAYSDYKE